FITDKLTNENAKSYLFNFALQGVQRLYNQNGFTSPESVTRTLKEFEAENNTVIQFLEDNDVENMKSTEAYNNYNYWAAQAQCKPYKLRTFNREIRKATGLELVPRRVDGKSCRIWNKE
ncbi:MAG: hypothetical protein L0G20_05470, partial [Lactobacillus sp.]|nr:hypothetical protein [Lactobacillus sp.]